MIHNFNGSQGSQPYAGITRDAAGNFYGTTEYGGMLSCDSGGVPGCGVAYKLNHVNSGWLFSVLYEFPGFDGDFLPTDPGNITIAPDGSPFGTQLFYPGDASQSIFNLMPPARASVAANTPWTYKLDYTFEGGNQGNIPSQVTFDAQGNIWGTALEGGVDGNGLVYEMTPSNGSWIQTVIYNFLGGADGSEPDGVMFDPQGNIYGVTRSGGNTGCGDEDGCGTVYELTHSASGWTKTILHVFNENTEGGIPGPLLRDSAGNLYGVTAIGTSNGGSIWELSPSDGGWVFNVLYNIPGRGNLISLVFRLVIDANGTLYGVNNYIGANLEGSAYKLAPSNGGWVYTDLHDFGSFPNQADGVFPRGPVALDPSGNIYGTAQQGGEGAGVIYEIIQ